MPVIRDDGSKTAAPGRVGDVDEYEDFLVTAHLLQHPRLARIYVYICYAGSTTIEDVVDALDLKRATTYEDIDELEAIDAVGRDETSRPHRIEASAFAYVDPDGIAITPTVLHAIALREIDDDVEYIYNRYGPGTVAAAVHLAAAHYAGRLTRRMAASDLGLQPVEGMALLAALEPVIAAGSAFDPYFELVAGDAADDVTTNLDASIERFRASVPSEDE